MSKFAKLAADGTFYKPTLLGCDNFDEEEMAKRLQAAMAGVGTNEDEIIEIVGSCNLEQRLALAKVYTTMFGKTLLEDLSSELSGNFRDLVKFSFMDKSELDAYCLYKAMKGMGTDEGTLVEILCSLTNEEMEDVKNSYEKLLQEKGKSGRTLESDVKSELSGFLKRICVALIQAGRKQPTDDELDAAMGGDIEAIVDRQAAQELAEELFKAGEDKWGTDESTFLRILARESCWQLAAVNNFYEELHGKPLLRAIEKEFSGKSEKALMIMLSVAIDRPNAIAELLHSTMAGLGTSDVKLCRLILTHTEVDLEVVKGAYEAKYDTTLAKDICGDTSGDYKKLLLKLIGESEE